MPLKLTVHKLLGICLLGVSLTSCQTTMQPAVLSAEDTWQTGQSYFVQRGRDISQLQAWQYSAKIGLTTGQRSEQANLLWHYRDQSNEVNLYGPLGAGAVKLHFDQYGVELSDNKGSLHRGKSAEHLLSDIVGWPLPIEALSYWLFVMPAPDAAFQYNLDQQGQVVSIRQFGWQIDFQDYRLYGKQMLPRRLTATKQVGKNPGELVKVKLITKGWSW
jgi:outer membrane lipoprotein LolB